ncbi:hypothetical protein [Tengunoibacter tsumagoiensis]|uniref:hypothetical protein n=1 Tax=Tengunoibacter tsumagoiensis TaxID=2014871 RepID=UPI000F817F37|nr:hypothetical protein [Tengunoibacter tsumagoiensis]
MRMGSLCSPGSLREYLHLDPTSAVPLHRQIYLWMLGHSRWTTTAWAALTIDENAGQQARPSSGSRNSCNTG